MKNTLFNVGIVVFLLAFLLWVLSSCYNQKKAQKQFGKAAITYPIIPAEYCANTFPPKDSTIRDTTLITDTLYMSEGYLTDTLITKDTVYITNTQIKTKVVTNTVRVTDTVYRENTAKLKACDIERGSLINQLNSQTLKANKYQDKSNKRGWIIFALIFILVGIVGYKAYSMFKVPLKKV